MEPTREQLDTGSDRERLAEGLLRVYPDLTIVDEQLEIGGGMVVDLVGVDARGRLALVDAVAETDERALLGLMAAATFAQTHLDLLSDHLGGGALSQTSPPLAVLVAGRVAPGFLERLEVLRPEFVRVYEERTIASARAGRGSYLRPVYPPAPIERPLPIPDAARFVRGLPEDLRAAAAQLVRRVARIDDEADCVASEADVRWTIGGEPLVTLRFEDGYLVGYVPATEPRRLTTAGDREAFLTQVIERCVALIGSSGGDEGDDDLLEELDPEDPDDGGGIFEVPKQLLTQEEIEAFQE